MEKFEGEKNCACGNGECGQCETHGENTPAQETPVETATETNTVDVAEELNGDDTEDTEDTGEQAPQDPNVPIDNAIRSFITNVFNSVDYQNIFEILGQPERYKDFDAYVVQMAAKDFKPAEGEVMKTWWNFLDDSPITSAQLAETIEYVTNLVLNVSIGSAKVVMGAMYENLIYGQFQNVQTQHEMFAHDIGLIARSLSRLEKLHPNESGSKPDETATAEADKETQTDDWAAATPETPADPT